VRIAPLDFDQLKGPILLTGHSGFKGTWLTFLLEELGIPVVGFSLPPLKESLYLRADRLGRIPEIFGDVRDLSLLRKTFREFKPECVVHLAAQPLVIDSYEMPIDTFATNVIGCANLLEVATTTESVRTIACITTDKVYENNNNNLKFLEGDALRGKDPYSASKVASESVIDAWRNLANHRNQAKVLTLRSGNVIGGGDYANNRLMPDIIRNIFLSESIVIRNPHATRPWQHVLDPLIGYLLSLKYALTDEVAEYDTFNFGPTEDSLSVAEVIDIVRSYYPRLNISEMIKNSKKTYEAETLQLDSTRANTLLGWMPKMSQKEAVISTISWWVDNLENNLDAEALCKNEIKKLLQK
jgi:CDP-glucose 4,6-dehydratase